MLTSQLNSSLSMVGEEPLTTPVEPLDSTLRPLLSPLIRSISQRPALVSPVFEFIENYYRVNNSFFANGRDCKHARYNYVVVVVYLLDILSK